MTRCCAILLRWLYRVSLAWSPAASAQDCAQATSQGTAPAGWQTYCWLNLANYNDATARTSAGQNLSFTLPDGSERQLALAPAGPDRADGMDAPARR